MATSNSLLEILLTFPLVLSFALHHSCKFWRLWRKFSEHKHLSPQVQKTFEQVQKSNSVTNKNVSLATLGIIKNKKIKDTKKNLQVASTKLVNQPFGSNRLLYNSFLIILAERSAEFVIIHSWSVLALTPQPSNMSRIFDFENAIFVAEPSDTIIMFVGFPQ